MSQKPGYPTRMQQVSYTRQSPNPAPRHNVAPVHESGLEEGRQPRDVAASGARDCGGATVDGTSANGAKDVCDAAERGPRKGDGAGLTYLCIEVLDGGAGCGGGSRGGGGGAGGGDVGRRGSDGGYPVAGGNGGWCDPQSSPAVATSDARPTAKWPSAVSSVPEVGIAPNWPPGSPVPPWQTFPPARDWPILDARMWPKYHYPPGRAEFAHAWCNQHSQSQIDEISLNRETTQSSQGPKVSPCFPQSQSHPIMWSPELYESWRLENSLSANKAFSRGEMEGPVQDHKDSGIDSPEPTQPDDTPGKSLEAVNTPQEESTPTLRGVKTDKTIRHGSKGTKKHSTRCKASLSTPLLPPLSESPNTRNSPVPVTSTHDETTINRVLSDESFVRGPTTPYHARRMKQVSGNDKHTMDIGNLDSLKPAKMIKPPRGIKPVKAFRIMKSNKTEGPPEGTQDIQHSRAITPQNGKAIKVNPANPNKLNTTLNQEPNTPVKVGTPVSNSIRSSLKSTLPKKDPASPRGMSPSRGVTNIHIGQRPATMCHEMATEKYTKNCNLNTTTYTAIDKFQSGDRIESINTINHSSENAINLVAKNSYESFQYEEVVRPTESINSNTYARREEMFNTEEPIKGSDFSRNEHERTSPFKDSRSVVSHRLETNVRRQEAQNKNFPENSTRDHINSNCSWPFENYASSNISRPKRSVTESTFRVPNLRCKNTLQPENCRRDAAVSTSPRLCVTSTQTDNENESDFGPPDNYGLYSRRHTSASLGKQRSERFSSDASGIISPTDPRNSGFSNPYPQDQYHAYRATLPIGNQDIINPMCYGGFVTDGSSRDYICNPCMGCPNSPQRSSYWTPGGPFPGYGMPMPMHMPMPMSMPMCMTMPMPMSCPCESCGGMERSGEMRRHVDVVDVAVGDSNKDRYRSFSRERIESRYEKKGSKQKQSAMQDRDSDSEKEEIISPTARKRIELLLAGLTPRGKTLHPERLNTLLQDISPGIIKRIIDENNSDNDNDEEKCYERSKIKQEGRHNKLRDLVNALSMTSENKLKEDVTETYSNIEICENVKVEEKNVQRSNENLKSSKDKKKVKIIALEEVDSVKLQEKESINSKEKTTLQEETAVKSKEELQIIVRNSVLEKDKYENEKENELKEETIKNTNKTPNCITKSVMKKVTEEIQTEKVDESNNKPKQIIDEDNEQKQIARHTLFRPGGEPSLLIKIRTRPLFRNQEIREINTTVVEDTSPRVQSGPSILTSTDTGSSTTSLNPETSISDITTVEAVPTQESTVSLNAISSLLVLEEHKISNPISTKAPEEESKCNESCPPHLEESVKTVCVEETEEPKETKGITVKEDKQLEKPNKQEVPKQKEEKTEKEPQYPERRYSICPCPGVTLTSSKPPTVAAKDQTSQVSRPTSPSRPVTVSPLRPIPRPAPPPRRQLATIPPLARGTARRRRIISSLDENGTYSAGNVNSAPRSGSIRPPRARVPLRLLQTTASTQESGGRGGSARKPCTWSRLSFIERTALARALVDSANCTVKVGDATVFLARSGLTSLMTIAEGILNQTPSTKTCTNNDRKSALSPTRSPARAHRSPSPPVRNPENKSNAVPEFQRKCQEKYAPTREHPEHTTPLQPTSTAQEGSNGSNTSVSKRDTKLGFRNSHITPPRAFSGAKGMIGKTLRNSATSNVDRNDESTSPDRDYQRQVPKAGRYCSMRIHGPLKKPSTPPLLPPPRGFRGHGRTSRGMPLMTRKNDTCTADTIRNSSTLKESSFKRRLNYSEKYENFRKAGAKFPNCTETKGKVFENKPYIDCMAQGGKMRDTKCESVKATRNSFYTRSFGEQSGNDNRDTVKIKNQIKDTADLLKYTTDNSSYPDIHEISTDLKNEIIYFGRIARKCKSLARVDTLLSEVSMKQLRNSLCRSVSTPTVRVNTVSNTLENRRRSGNLYRSNHSCNNRSGNSLYRPSGHARSRLIFRPLNHNETKNRAVVDLSIDPMLGIAAASFGGAHPDCCFTITAASQRRGCPSNSAPPGPKAAVLRVDSSRARTSMDDFFVLHPPRHTLQPGRPSRPRLPVTAVAAAQRVVSRSQSYASATQSAPQPFAEWSLDERGATVRSTLQVLPVRTPPTPWRDT